MPLSLAAQEISVSAKLLTVYQLVGKEEYREALNEINEVLAIDDTKINAYIFGGLCHKSLGNYDSADIFFDKALEIKPEDGDVHFLKAENFFEAGKIDASQKEVEVTLYYDNNYYKAHILQAKIYHEKGDFLKAEQKLLMVMNEQHYNLESRELLADIYLELADTALALNVISQALLIDPHKEDNLKFRIGLLNDLKLYEALIHDLNEYIPQVQNEPEMYFKRGFAYLSTGDTVSSLRDFNEVLYLDKDYAKAYYYRAIVRNALYDKEGACGDFEEAKLKGYLPDPSLMETICSENIIQE